MFDNRLWIFIRENMFTKKKTSLVQTVKTKGLRWSKSVNLHQQNHQSCYNPNQRGVRPQGQFPWIQRYSFEMIFKIIFSCKSHKILRKCTINHCTVQSYPPKRSVRCTQFSFLYCFRWQSCHFFCVFFYFLLY